MFSRVDGPTALHEELIRALSLSLGEAEVQSEDGTGIARGGVAAVWNGRKGRVVLLVRYRKPDRLARWVLKDPIRSLPQLESAVEEGLGFLNRMGFLMDDPAFVKLEPAQQVARIRSWEELRGVPVGPPPRAEQSGREASSEIAAAVAEELSGFEPATQGGETSLKPVLGRIRLVQRVEREGSRPAPITRILSSF